MKFKCRVCGCESYSELLSEIFACDNCSILFSDPNKFNVNSGALKKNITNDNVVNIRPARIGTVISSPVKLNRKS